jgi:hypothetical protein
MKSKLSLLFAAIAFMLTGALTLAQETKTVNGIVTVFKQYPLNKVTVFASGTGKTILTDSIGRFSIVCSVKDVLKVSASGFQTRSIKTGKQTVLQIDLLFEDNAGDFNAAVTGGHISEKTLKYAIDEDLKKSGKDYSKYNSIYELISSEVYQVAVKGNVVYNKSIRSMDSNPQIIFDVDGKIMTDISYISPNYVKSLEFIDDVGATMYGSKGANGVLKITLKSREN